MKTRVLIVEDNNLLRKGLQSLIADIVDYEVVGEAVDGKNAIEQTALLKPDLVLMDLSMPGLSGFEATKQIKRRLPHVKIIILTISNNEEFVREALRIGADGYLLKGATFEELAMAMQTVVHGKRFICNDISLQMVEKLLDPAAESSESAWEKLNERERSILKLVAEGHTNRSAAAFLYISQKTVEKYRASLMRKLALTNAAELILTAIDMGLIERTTNLGITRSGGHNHTSVTWERRGVLISPSEALPSPPKSIA